MAPYSPLQDAFREEIRICVATVGQGPSAGQQRKRHANLQERVQGLWNSTRLFEKALALFEGLCVCVCVCACVCMYVCVRTHAILPFNCSYIHTQNKVVVSSVFKGLQKDFSASLPHLVVLRGSPCGDSCSLYTCTYPETVQAN